MNIFVNRYKIPLLISLVVAIGIIALSVESNVFKGLLVFLGSILAMFFLDLEIIIANKLWYGEIIENNNKHSISSLKKVLDQIINSKSISMYLALVEKIEYRTTSLIFQSAIFQIVLLILTLFLIYTDGNLFVKSFVLSLNAHILYAEFLEYTKTKNIDRWFYFYVGEKSRFFYISYFLVIISIFIYSFRYI